MTKNSATVQEDGPSAYNYHYEVVDGPHFSAWEKRQGYSTQVSETFENWLLKNSRISHSSVIVDLYINL
jgi:hypothetical protein